jgi:hypothetical protein
MGVKTGHDDDDDDEHDDGGYNDGSVAMARMETAVQGSAVSTLVNFSILHPKDMDR